MISSLKSLPAMPRKLLRTPGPQNMTTLVSILVGGRAALSPFENDARIEGLLLQTHQTHQGQPIELL